MTTVIPQLILSFPLDSVCTFANLLEGDGNHRAITAVQAFLRTIRMAQAHATSLIVTGEEGTGKTHLLQAAVHHIHTHVGKTAAIYLDSITLQTQLQESREQVLTQFLERYETCQLVAIDNLEEVASSPVLQEGLLYLFNQMRGTQGGLLIAGRNSPQRLATLRPDLRSRLLWGELIPLDPPEDELLGAILLKMVEDRQVRCAPELLKFLQLRLPRCIPDYAAAIERLNDASLGLKRPLTVPLAKQVLGL